jgi:hypothetical protein
MAAGTGQTPKGNNDVAAPSEVVIWDAATGRELARMTDKESIRNYSALAFSPNASFLIGQTGTGAGIANGRNSMTIWGRLPAPEPEAVKPPVNEKNGNGTPTAKPPAQSDGTVPVRFQNLFRDLSDEGVTDARRVETVFLAALGRFPTDVEARTLTAQFARSGDKAAALKDLLGTLIETAEFKAHAEELKGLADEPGAKTPAPTPPAPRPKRKS